MTITLKNTGKRFNYEWIFRRLNLEFSEESRYVILGANGSGKSTLLQILAGSLLPSEGSVLYNGGKTDAEEIFSSLAFAAPYLELFEDLTFREAVLFHSKFKKFRNDMMPDDVLQITGLEKSANKQIKYFSSGMKQRVKLALAILSDTPLLLLDEPGSNLDRAAITWYQNLIDFHSGNRLIIVASNQQEYEYPFCNKQIHIGDLKTT